MSDIKEIETLQVLLKASNIKWSIEETVNTFKNPRYDKKKLLQLVQSLFNNDATLVSEFQKQSEASGNFPALMIMLKKLSSSREQLSVKNKSSKKSISFSNETQIQQQSPPIYSRTTVFDTPKISSTKIMINQSPDNSVLIDFDNIKVNRSSALWNFNDFPENVSYKQLATAGIPFSAQEAIVVKEVLYLLVGVKSSMIVPHIKENSSNNTMVEFSVSSDMSETLRDLVQEITPLASYYANVQSFIQYAILPKNGQVLHSLSDALKTIINDYYMSIARLESMHSKQRLSLHKIIYFLRPIIIIMEKLSEITTQIRTKGIRGGNVLTLLHERQISLNGDKATQDILRMLSGASAVPYLEMLKLWISKGIIYDPGNEFFIIDGHHESGASKHSLVYWEGRYVFQPEKIPVYFKDFADKILRTGKYLNAIRECGYPLTIEDDVNFKLIHSEKKYAFVVNEAYNYASSSLLKLIMEEYDLVGRFLSVKRYFLLQQGDFIAQFMDACEQELVKNVEKVIPMKLKSLLELTLRVSSAKFDKYQDDLSTILLPYSLLTQMTRLMSDTISDNTEDPSELIGIDCFSFGYEVQWPMSIVFNQGVIAKYQMIFRELFYFKHVERLLHRLWTVSNTFYNMNRKPAIDLYRPAFTLRQRMMNAIQNIEYYLMIEVIEPHWHLFFQKLGKVKNIDDVLILHQEFLDQCLKNCMLTYPTLLKSVMSVCNICIEFCDFIQVESERKVDAGFQDKVRKFSESFTSKILALLRQIHDLLSQNVSETKFLNLVHRINSNSFYSENKSVGGNQSVTDK